MKPIEGEGSQVRVVRCSWCDTAVVVGPFDPEDVRLTEAERERFAAHDEVCEFSPIPGLRKQLFEAQGLLAQARENLLVLDGQRAAIERDLKQLRNSSSVSSPTPQHEPMNELSVLPYIPQVGDVLQAFSDRWSGPRAAVVSNIDPVPTDGATLSYLRFRRCTVNVFFDGCTDQVLVSDVRRSPKGNSFPDVAVFESLTREEISELFKLEVCRLTVPEMGDLRIACMVRHRPMLVAMPYRDGATLEGLALDGQPLVPSVPVEVGETTNSTQPTRPVPAAEVETTPHAEQPVVGEPSTTSVESSTAVAPVPAEPVAAAPVGVDPEN